MQKIAVVILNWNGKPFLEKFLPPLVSHTPPWAEIVVADNASSDDSVEFMQSHYPHLR
jgi:GT2 family glycosyltransferase